MKKMKKLLNQIEFNINQNINSSRVSKIFRSYLEDASITQKILEKLLKQNYNIVLLK